MISPYVFERGPGLVHVRLRSNPKDCIGDCRTDVFELIWAEARREAVDQMAAILARERAEQVAAS